MQKDLQFAPKMVYLQGKEVQFRLERKSFFQKYIRKDWNRESFRWLLTVAVAALLLTFLMESFARRSVVQMLRFATDKPLVFLYNYLIILFTMTLPLLFRRRLFGLSFVSFLWLAIAVSNFVSQTFRSMPLTASDVWIMSSVRDIISKYLSPLLFLLLLVGISLLLGAGIFFWAHTKKKTPFPAFAATHILLFGVLLAVGGSWLISAEALDDTTQFGNLQNAYRENGFTYSFSASLVTSGIDKPKNYSRTAVERVLEEQDNALPQSAAEKPNIVFVQLESFFDAECMVGLTYSENPTPNFQKLKQTCTTGLFSAPCIGAGTANTEFEVLTGMNLCHFGVGEYPYVSIVDSSASDSVAQTLSLAGYATHALHNNNATFYSRNDVYANLGFDTFTSLEYMEDVECNIRGWAKDAVLTDEILQALDSTQERDFVFAVSVQPHGKYPKELPEEETPLIDVTGMDDEQRAAGFSYYLGQLRECDEFVGELIAALSAYDEPTMVVFYGDHLPSFNIQPDELSYGDSQSTEYVIWANYDLPKQDRDLQSYQLTAYALELAGLHEGNLFRCHQYYGYASDSDKAYQSALMLLEYDAVEGKQYGYAQPIEATDITLGTVEIRITGLTDNDDTFAVTGEHFTPYSVVCVNGTQVNTRFISSELLLVEDAMPDDGDTVTVVQVSASDSTVELSETAPFTVQKEE